MIHPEAEDHYPSKGPSTNGSLQSMQYFDQLKEVLEEHDLMDCPGQLYNVYETGMPFDHRASNVVAKKGQKKVRYQTSGNKSQVTVIGCVSAAGHAIPPFVIFDSKTLNHESTEGEVYLEQLMA